MYLKFQVILGILLECNYQHILTFTNHNSEYQISSSLKTTILSIKTIVYMECVTKATYLQIITNTQFGINCTT